MQGSWYCGVECLKPALAAILERQRSASSGRLPVHRIPLGLLLLSRQQLTPEQLRLGLAEQRSSGAGKIGEWLQRLGFVTELQVTGALARQWSCPVLRMGSVDFAFDRANTLAAIPHRLLEESQMIPADFSEVAGVLLVAFCEAVNHSALYAIERMLGYRTEACFVCPSVLRQALLSSKQIRRPDDVIFDRMEDFGEGARIVASYCAKLGTEQIRLARCGKHVWVRLQRGIGETVNLLLHFPGKSSVP